MKRKSKSVFVVVELDDVSVGVYSTLKKAQNSIEFGYSRKLNWDECEGEWSCELDNIFIVEREIN